MAAFLQQIAKKRKNPNSCAAGFDFAARHRWSLQGRALSPGTPELFAVPGQERDGDWVPQPLRH